MEPTYTYPFENVAVWDEKTGEPMLCDDTFNEEEFSNTVAENMDNDKDDVVFDEVTDDEGNRDIKTLVMFGPDYPRIYASFDLSNYVDVVNTDSIMGTFNEKEKTLEITLSDIRDYQIFKLLLKEKTNKPPFFKRLCKKPRSIFMYVTEELDSNLSTKTCYEFVGCRVQYLYDSEYGSKRDEVY